MRVIGRIETAGSPSERVVVTLVGDHDLSTAPELRRVLKGAIADGSELVVDLTETTFIDSSILHALLDASCTLEPGNGDGKTASGRLALRFGSAHAIRHVCEVAGVLDQFELVESD